MLKLGLIKFISFYKNLILVMLLISLEIIKLVLFYPLGLYKLLVLFILVTLMSIFININLNFYIKIIREYNYLINLLRIVLSYFQKISNFKKIFDNYNYVYILKKIKLLNIIIILIIFFL